MALLIALVKKLTPSQSSEWKSVAPQVAAGENFSAVLLSNGTVQAYGDNSEGQLNCQEWKNVVKIAAKGSVLVGLTSDGKILSTNKNYQIKAAEWNKVEDIALSDTDLIALTSDHHVLSSSTTLASRFEDKDIDLICGGYNGSIVVLDDDGVISHYSNGSATTIATVTDPDIVSQIAYGSHHIVILKTDGTVTALITDKTESSGECDVSSWTDVIDIATGDGFTIGLKSDGTILTAGNNDYGQLFVETWEEISDIDAGYHFTVALD